MKSLTLFLVLLASASQGSVPAALSPPAVLHPSGPWAVEYGKNMCVLSRAFGTGNAKIYFAFKPAPNSNSGRIMLIRMGAHGQQKQTKAEIILSDGSRPPWANFWHAVSKGTSLTAIDLPRSSLAPLLAGGSITIRAGKDLNLSIVPTGMSKAVDALAKCEADLLKTWGMDEAAQSSLAKLPEPIGNFSNFFKPDDYPENLLMDGVQGSVGVVIDVDSQGLATNCRIVETSGTDGLDQATCKALRKRAKFKPALSHTGAAMASLTYWRVNWQIVDDYRYSTGGLSPPASSSMSIAQ